MKRTLTATSFCLAAALSTTAANAALQSRLGGAALYDDVANLTWLQDANYAKTSGYDPDGLMVGRTGNTWNCPQSERSPCADAKTWVASLNIDGVTGWRLPAGPMDFGYNQAASEMGNLFYNVLGGVAGVDIATTHNANYYLFKNIQSNGYWSGVESRSSDVWVFFFNDGNQGLNSNDDSRFSWAVHSGDVHPVPVPLPPSLPLFIASLGYLGGMSRRVHCV